MAGFREFVTGEVLTAANVDDFLAKQVVQKYADAAARDAALGTAVAGGNALREGMIAYLDSTNDVLKYDGSSWSSVGGLVAVKSAIFTGTQTASVTAGGNLTVNDIEITHEVADPANKLIISAFIGAAASTIGRVQVGIAIHDGSALIDIGAVEGSRTRLASAGPRISTAVNRTYGSPSVTFVHTPGSGSKTYTVRALNIDTGTQTLFINRNELDSNDAANPRAVSSLVIQEVKV